MKPFYKAVSPGVETLQGYLLKIFFIAVIYHMAARLGLMMAYVQNNTSPVWPPTGIALATLLIFGYSAWPGISLGVLVGSLVTGADPAIALAMTVGNTLEALVGAYLLKRFFDFRNNMERIRDVLGLALVATFSATISATIGAGALALTGQTPWVVFGDIWSTWWIGDLLGALVVAPVLVVWISPPSIKIRRPEYVEGALLLLLLILVSWYVFGSVPRDGILHQALIYMVFPFVIWAALRLGQQGATLTTLLVSGIAIWGTVQGLGPFALESKNESLILLQTFMGVVSLTALILAAATLERRAAAKALQQRAEELGTLTDASRSFLDNFDIASIYQTICRLAVTRLGLDAAWIEGPEGGNPAPLVAFNGLSPDAIQRQKRDWESHLGRSPLIANRIDTVNGTHTASGSEPTYKAYAAFPLVFSNQPMGALKLLSKNKAFFTPDKQLLVQSYANLAVVVIQNALLFDELRATNRQLHGLSQRLMKAQEDERLHLSRELHDEAGQLLAALTVQFGLLEREAPESFRVRVGELKNAANAVQTNLHHLAVNLRPASLDHLGLITALHQSIREFKQQYAIDVEFEALGIQDERLPSEIETALYRIVQEALTNVALHAKATRVDVLLSRTQSCISIIVEDNGVGFIPTSTDAEEQIGLFGMRERVEMLGGKLSIESSPGKGTTIKAEVPCK
ncbi:MAG: MASE1 domain-containing protein [Anaerolineales bacterium]